MTDPRNDISEQPQLSNEAPAQLLSPYLESTLHEVQQAFSQGMTSAYKYLQSLDFSGRKSPGSGAFSPDKLLQDLSLDNDELGWELPAQSASRASEKVLASNPIGMVGQPEDIFGDLELSLDGSVIDNSDAQTSAVAGLDSIGTEKPSQTVQDKQNATNRLGTGGDGSEGDDPILPERPDGLAQFAKNLNDRQTKRSAATRDLDTNPLTASPRDSDILTSERPVRVQGIDLTEASNPVRRSETIRTADLPQFPQVTISSSEAPPMSGAASIPFESPVRAQPTALTTNLDPAKRSDLRPAADSPQSPQVALSGSPTPINRGVDSIPFESPVRAQPTTLTTNLDPAKQSDLRPITDSPQSSQVALNGSTTQINRGADSIPFESPARAQPTALAAEVNPLKQPEIGRAADPTRSPQIVLDTPKTPSRSDTIIPEYSVRAQPTNLAANSNPIKQSEIVRAAAPPQVALNGPITPTTSGSDTITPEYSTRTELVVSSGNPSPAKQSEITRNTSELATSQLAYTLLTEPNMDNISGDSTLTTTKTSSSSPLSSSANLAQNQTESSTILSNMGIATNIDASTTSASVNNISRFSELLRDQNNSLSQDTSSIASQLSFGPNASPLLSTAFRSFMFEGMTIFSRDTNSVPMASSLTFSPLMVMPVSGGQGPVNALGSNQNIRDAQISTSIAGNQYTGNLLQGMQQAIQGSTKSLDEGSKSFVIGTARLSGMNTAPSEITGKKGISIQTENANTLPIPTPTSLIGKLGNIVDTVETKVQANNVTSGKSPLTNTVAPGSQTAGQTSSATTPIAAGTNTDPNNKNAGSKKSDSGNADIDSLVATLPPLIITGIDQVEESEASKISRGPEISDDFDFELDKDEDRSKHKSFTIDWPQPIEGRRINSFSTKWKQDKTKLIQTNIENLIVYLNDIKKALKNLRVGEELLSTIWCDLILNQDRLPHDVHEGDTLWTIARYFMKEERLAKLLYTVNVHKKILEPIKDDNNLEAIYAIEPIKLLINPTAHTILLPTRPEILRYKVHVLKDNRVLMFFAQKPDEQGYITYKCRKGDTLESLARTLPALQGIENGWQEIASINGLSLLCDRRGKPFAKLEEGQIIKLPALDEEEEEVQEASAELILSQAYQDLELEISTKKAVEKLKSRFNFDPKNITSIHNILESAQTRVITQGDLGDGAANLSMKLVLKLQDIQLDVVEYNINSTSKTLTLYSTSGNRTIIPLNLPTRAVRELAENDLRANAKTHCIRFLEGSETRIAA